EPVAAMPNELAANIIQPIQTMQEPHVVQMKQAPLKAQLPTEEEVEITEVFTVVTPAAALPAAQRAPQLPSELPHTASSLPLIGLIGILSLGTAFVLHYGVRREQTRSGLRAF